jgi:hypothetical protein
MTTSIELDTDVFQEAERQADALHLSVGDFCSLAIREFVQNRRTASITERLNAVYTTYRPPLDDDILQAQYDLLGEEDW